MNHYYFSNSILWFLNAPKSKNQFYYLIWSNHPIITDSTTAPLAFRHNQLFSSSNFVEPANHCSLRRAMSGASEKDLITTAAARRVASVANHLSPPQPAPCSLPSIGSSSCSSSMNDSYHRVHGEVPAHVPVWRLVPSDDESGKEFTDIIYEKAVGEAIAKVRTMCLLFHIMLFHFSIC